MTRKAGMIISGLSVCLFALSGCALVPEGEAVDGESSAVAEDFGSGNGNSVDGENIGLEGSDEPEELSSQFWLPISVMQYDTEGNLLKSIEYRYDDYGFINYFKGIGCWGGTSEEPAEYTFSSVYDEASRTAYLSGGNHDTEYNLEYYFDEDGMITGQKSFDGNVYMFTPEQTGLDNESIKERIRSNFWLDESGEIDMDRLPALSPVYVSVTESEGYKGPVIFENGEMKKDPSKVYTIIELNIKFVNDVIYTQDKKYKLKAETDEEGVLVEYPNKFASCNIAMPSIWKYHSEKNSDGTVTTTVCYESGEVCEIVVWIPATKMGYLQNVYFDWDYDYNYIPTLSAVFHG